MLTRPILYLKNEIGGAHGVLVTAVSPNAFEQALGMVRRGGTISLNGLPPDSFPLPIFDMVLNGITVRGSIVGTRLDLPSPVRERCVPLSPPSGSRTSTTCSRACMPARSTGAWFWICR